MSVSSQFHTVVELVPHLAPTPHATALLAPRFVPPAMLRCSCPPRPPARFIRIFRFVMALRMLVTSIISTLKALPCLYSWEKTRHSPLFVGKQMGKWERAWKAGGPKTENSFTWPSDFGQALATKREVDTGHLLVQIFRSLVPKTNHWTRMGKDLRF